MDEREPIDRLTDTLMQVPLDGLDALDSVANDAVAVNLCPRLRNWLVASTIGERARRQFRSVEVPALELSRFTDAELAGGLAFSFCLVRAAVEPLAEQFAVTLHKLVISHVAAVLLGHHATQHTRN